MRYLEVEEDGSLTELTELSLGPEKVIIVIDEDDKRMWLWKGQNCPIRKKFIGSRALSDLRKKEYGFAYVPQSCDQGEETAEFVQMLQKIGRTDLVSKEVLEKATAILERQKNINVFEEAEIRPSEIKSSTAESDVRIKSRPAQVSPTKLPSHIAKMGAPGNRPIPTILSALDSADIEIKTPEQKVTKEKKDIELEKSFKILRDLGTPKGFYRDLVIIGTKVYTETYDNKFEELDEPPEGVFFSRSHVPRMICENGIVRAIEFLKPEEGAQLSEEDEKIAQDIEDLLAMFEIEVG